MVSHCKTLLTDYNKQVVFLILLACFMQIDLNCQDHSIQGKWIMIKSEFCDGSQSSIHSFPNQHEMTIGTSFTMRYDLFDHFLKSEYSYTVNDNILDVKDHSTFEIISCDSTDLVMKLELPDGCYLYTFKRKYLIYDEKFQELQSEVVQTDTFYYSTLSIYPRYYGVDRFMDVFVQRFGRPLSKAGHQLFDLKLYLREDGEVVNADFDKVDDPKLQKKISKFLYNTSGQWKIMNVFDESLNLIYEVTIVI